MSDCRRFQCLIDQYLDGTISPNDLESLKAHTNACQSCAEGLRRSTLMREVIVDAFEPQATVKDAAARIMAGLPSRPQSVGIRAFSGRLAVAAAILLAVGAIAGFTVGRTGSAPTEERAGLTPVPMRVAGLEGTVLVRREGSDTWHALKSDSPVYLGDAFHCMSKSNLTLDVGEKSTVQIVENSLMALKSYNGETRFHLEHGHCRASLQSPHGPFFISTPHGRVEALGTEFTVTVE